MSRGLVIGCLTGLFLLGIIGVGKSRSKQKDNEQQKYQLEVGQATPVQLNIMSQRQRFHSSLHNGAGMRPGGKTMSNWLASYKGQRIVLGTDIFGRRFFTPEQLREAPTDVFRRFAKDSDAVIRGKVINRASQITQDDSFLFTDYEVVVLEVFKNNAIAPLDTGTTVTFTSLGGEIVVDDVILKAGGMGGVPLLAINAQEVLLFVKFVSETGSYKLSHYDGIFELDGISARPLAGYFHFDPIYFKNESSFLKTIKAVSTK